MFKGIRRELRTLRSTRPGTRFEGAHDRHRVDNRILRWSLIAIGIALVLVGALTFWIPGPNFVIVLGGLALVAAQWRFVARQLDRGEVSARRWNDEHWDPYPHKRRVIAFTWLIVAALVVTGVWVADRQGWLPGWVPLLG